jgi:probable HAF family extracellular repeat protein
MAALGVAAIGSTALTGAAPAAGSVGPHVIRPYRVMDLGLPGLAEAINDRGDAVGRAEFVPGLDHPFLWRRGRLIDLGELKPTFDGSGAAFDVNNRGQVVGYSNVGSKSPMIGTRAFIWQNGVMIALNTPGTDSMATAINERGQVVGTYGTVTDTHAFLWQRGVLTDLGLGIARDINDRGQVVGSRLARNGEFVPTVWYRGRATDLRPRPISSMWAGALNNAGWVAGGGWVESEILEYGYLWRCGTARNLGSLGLGNTSTTDINDRGQVVGMTGVRDTPDYPIPFLWQNGVMTDLRRRGLAGATVMGLNDRGQLAGSVETPDGRHAAVFL